MRAGRIAPVEDTFSALRESCLLYTSTANRSAGKATWCYLDEFHLLLKEEQTAAYSVEIWKRIRKWGGVPTGITRCV